MALFQPPDFGGTVDETAENHVEIRFIEQEGIVALVTFDFDTADIARRGIERVGQLAAFGGGKAPVA